MYIIYLNKYTSIRGVETFCSMSEFSKTLFSIIHILYQWSIY